MPFLGGISLKLNTFMLLSNIQSAIASFQDHMLVVWIYKSPKVWCDMGKFFQGLTKSRWIQVSWHCRLVQQS